METKIIAGLILIALIMVIIFLPWTLGRVINQTLKIDSTMHPINNWLVGIISLLTVSTVIMLIYLMYNIILIQLN
jgi:hypothetical protein